MTPKKTQKELEQVVKGYQLDALEVKVDAVLGKLDEIKNNTSGLVSQRQLDDMTLGIDKQIQEEVEKIHLEYKPLKKNITWFVRAMVLEAIAIVGQGVIMVVLYISSRGGG
jgi:hypothetical protein